MSENLPRRKLVADCLSICDFILLIGLGILTYWVRHQHLDYSPLQFAVLVLGALSAVMFFKMTDVYQTRTISQFVHALRTIALGGLLCVIFLVVLGYFAKVGFEISRLWMLSWTISGYFALIGFRAAVFFVFFRGERKAFFDRRVVLVGQREMLDKLEDRLKESALNTRVVKEFSLDLSTYQEADLNDIVDQLTQLAHARQVDDVIIAMNEDAGDIVQALVSRVHFQDVNFALCVQHSFLPFSFKGETVLAGIPLLHILDRPMTGWASVVKGIEDKVLGCLFLILTAPILGLCMLAIKLESRGPVLFKQQRLGAGNRAFTVYKLRTMYVDRATQAQVSRHDPRVTKVGQFLRKYSLDELPQFLNVIKGDMSIVGPRPHALHHNQDFATRDTNYFIRHRIKPGITGWAQVNGCRGEIRDDEALQARINYDLYYLENWSLGLDLWIIIRSFLIILNDDNAY